MEFVFQDGLESTDLSNPLPGCLVGEPDGDGDGDNPHNCVDVGFEDLASVSSIDNVEQPEVCCGEITDPEDIAIACELECGYAACKLANAKIREAAAIVGTGTEATERLNGDLIAVAEIWEAASKLQQCAATVTAAAGNWVEIDFGGGPSAALPGHLKYVEMHIRCAPDTEDPYVEVSPQDTCEASVNTEPPAVPASEGTLVPGAVTFFGPYGNGYSDITSVSYLVSNPGCSTPPCPFSVTRFDIDLDDISVGSFNFHDIRLQLSDTADGTIDGPDVVIPAGELEFDVIFKLKIDGRYLFGTNDLTLNFSTTDSTEAEVDSAGAFAVRRARFELGEELALLNTE
jgi:hypothetical protein